MKTFTGKQRVIIKGNKDGLVFLLDDRCDFKELMDELTDKLENTHQKFLSGPVIYVYIKLGNRVLTREQKEAIRDVFKRQGNLFIKSMEANWMTDPEPFLPGGKFAKILRGIVRSGQTLVHEGNLIYLGDVNPGGTMICTGDVYILGALRGTVHAGSEGDESAIIAASYLKPTQLRIAGVVSRPAEEWGIGEAIMEFAYLKDGRMEIDKIQNLPRIRPERVGLGGNIHE